MAEIIPFKGLRYNLQKVGDYSKVIAPPYDVISQKMRESLYESSDYNIIRLIYNKSAGEGRYSDAARQYHQWQEEDVLIEDGQPAIYIYEQDFEYHGQLLKRKGFIAALKLKPLGEGLIYPHERTMSRPREDRLKLLKATKANLSPIFALYIDGNQIKQVLDEVSQAKPDVNAVDSAGVTQKLWLLINKEKIKIIQQAMKGKELFIADGHHRYETSLMYQQELGVSPNGSRPSDYTMMMFVDMDDKGVIIKSTHRIVTMSSVSFEQLKNNLADDFVLQRIGSLEEIMKLLKANRDKVVFGLSDSQEFWFLKYKFEPEFNLSILHRELKRYLGIKSATVQDYIEFSADSQKALKHAGGDKVVFFVNPTPIETVKNMARAHQIMPQKSTYFYPKLTDGLVIRKLMEG